MTAIVLRGDAAHLPLPDNSCDLIVTSPPYWGQRSYTDAGEHYDGQIGSEATPQEYLEGLWRCTAEWVRVLKPEGSIFVNLGDKYSGAQQQTSGRQSAEASSAFWRRTDPARTGIPNKSLMGLPWRYALGCIDRLGLILRQDCIDDEDGGAYVWAKRNGLPESVTDRCRRAHEYIFHFVKQPRYYSAVDEIREAYAPGTAERYRSGYGPNRRAVAGEMRGSAGTIFNGELFDTNPSGKLPGSVWEIPTAPLVVPDHVAHARCCGGRKRPGCTDGLDHFAAFPPALPARIILGWSPSGICLECGEGRFPVVCRDVIPLRPGDRPGVAGLNGDAAHGADRRAGTHKLSLNTITGYACPCTPYTDHPERRRPSVTPGRALGRGHQDNDARAGEVGTRHHGNDWPERLPTRDYHHDGWVAPPTRPAVVVDPFGGTGTTSLVADVLGRTGITVDRSADYCRLARWRTTDPGERARALGVPKPPPVPEGQRSLFDQEAS